MDTEDGHVFIKVCHGQLNTSLYHRASVVSDVRLHNLIHAIATGLLCPDA